MSEKPLSPPPVSPYKMPGEDMAVVSLIILGAFVVILAVWKFLELLTIAIDKIHKAVL